MSMVPAADCHAHVFCRAAYPFASEPVYVPDPSQRGTVSSFLAVLDAHGLTHGLLVAAQPYGRDNRCMLDAIAAAIEAFTLDNCVWGSDWPFVRVNERVDYGPGLACLRRWLPDSADRHKVLWANPVRLFGFAQDDGPIPAAWPGRASCRCAARARSLTANFLPSHDRRTPRNHVHRSLRRGAARARFARIHD